MAACTPEPEYLSAGRPVLAGITVVDASTWIAGPVATMLMAEAGADVIKVESPEGDPARALAGFATWGRSKRSVVLDLRTPVDRASFQQLLDGADVLVHSFRPSVAASLGLRDDQLAEAFPRLVWCAITGWPRQHPDAERLGYDILVQAATGMMDEELGTRPGPVFLRFPYGSWSTGWLSLVGVLARLRARALSGTGGPAYTNLVQSTLAAMSKHWSRAEHPTPMMTGSTMPKGMNLIDFCADGLALATTMSDVTLADVPLFSEVAAELGLESPPGLVAPELTKTVIGGRPRATWLAAMQATGMPAVPVLDRVGAAFSEEQVIANDYVVTVDDPAWGRVVEAGHPIRIEPALAVRCPAPRLGEHTDEVLAEFSAVAPAGNSRQRSPGGSELGAARPLRGPLEGLKVVDFAMFLAGSYGSQLMADLGADVVKVEPVTGDRLRAGNERCFAGCQRGKRSVALDLRSPRSRPVLEQLLQWADVVSHNQRQPAARRLGLDYESVAKVNPSIIYCHVSGYGPAGPWKDWPGVDPTAQALVGWMQEGAGRGNPPRWLRIGMTDDHCAMSSVAGVLMAWMRRDKTGLGSDIRASILGPAILSTSEVLVREDGTSSEFPSLDALQTGVSTTYRIYECSDGWVAVAAVGERARLSFELACDSTMAEAIEAFFRQSSVDDVLETLDKADVPAARVLSDQEATLFDSELNRRLGITVDYEHPVWGRLEQLGVPLSFGDLDATPRRPPPTVGEHTAEVLSEIGIPAELVTELAAEGVIAGEGLEKG